MPFAPWPSRIRQWPAAARCHVSINCASPIYFPTDLLLTALQDGFLCIHDCVTQQLSMRIDLSSLASAAVVDQALPKEGDPPSELSPVAAVCFSPCNPSSVFAAVGHACCMIDLRASTSSSQASAPVQQIYRFCKDDVGGIAVNFKGNFLAMGDDTGAVQVAVHATQRS